MSEQSPTAAAQRLEPSASYSFTMRLHIAQQGNAFARVAAAIADAQGTWSWRERQYREKLKSGDVLALAAVLHDLAAQPRLTAREDQLHDRLRALLASELACALQIDITQAGTYIDQHVARARRSQATPTATGP